MGVKCFKTIEEYIEFTNFDNKRRLNEREYAKQHPAEKIHYIFHGSCLNYITPLHYGIGNYTGCKYYNGCSSDYPELRIINFIKD